jgi:hypothetical protein
MKFLTKKNFFWLCLILFVIILVWIYHQGTFRESLAPNPGGIDPKSLVNLPVAPANVKQVPKYISDAKLANDTGGGIFTWSKSKDKDTNCTDGYINTITDTNNCANGCKSNYYYPSNNLCVAPGTVAYLKSQGKIN